MRLSLPFRILTYASLIAFSSVSQIQAQTSIDTTAPVIVCKTTPLRFELTTFCFYEAFVEEFFDTIYDSQFSRIQKAICFDCTEFPIDVNGNPNLSLSLGLPLYDFPVTVWARDSSGNTSSCVIPSVQLVDHTSTCDYWWTIPNPLRLFAAEGDSSYCPLGNFQFEINSSAVQPYWIPRYDTVTITTDAAGNIPPTVLPYYLTYANYFAEKPSTDWSSDVDVLDAATIMRHLLGLASIAHPLRQLAADVNNSQTITAADVVAIRKIILSGSPLAPVPGPYQFRLLSNNLSGILPIFGLVGRYDNLAVYKVGNVVSNTATCTAFTTNTDRDTRQLQLSHKDFKAGEIADLGFQFPSNAEAVQFELALNGLEYVPYAKWQDAVSWNAETGKLRVALLGKDEIAQFQPQFRAIFASNAKEMVELSSDFEHSLVPEGELYQQPFTLRFQEQQSVTLSANPNPTWLGTKLSWNASTHEVATLRVVDALGRLVFETQVQSQIGENSVILEPQYFLLAGCYTVTLNLNKTVLATQILKM